jgi:two-component system sensor histidine kinase RegB
VPTCWKTSPKWKPSCNAANPSSAACCCRPARRGRVSIKTTINTFLDSVAEDWRKTRPVEIFEYRNLIEQDVPVAFDSAIKQMLGNVLDNAFEVSPVAGAGGRREDLLLMEVSDRGPGFPTG